MKAAARGADVLYTNVWVSMGKEAESAARLKALKGWNWFYPVGRGCGRAAEG